MNLENLASYASSNLSGNFLASSAESSGYFYNNGGNHQMIQQQQHGMMSDEQQQHHPPHQQQQQHHSPHQLQQQQQMSYPASPSPSPAFRFGQSPMHGLTSPALARALSTLGADKGRRPRSEKKPIPEEQKDDKYFERRRRNNEAAKRSRDARKAREDELALRASFLEKDNSILKVQVHSMREEAMKLREMWVAKCQGMAMSRQMQQQQNSMQNTMQSQMQNSLVSQARSS